MKNPPQIAKAVRDQAAEEFEQIGQTAISQIANIEKGQSTQTQKPADSSAQADTQKLQKEEETRKTSGLTVLQSELSQLQKQKQAEETKRIRQVQEEAIKRGQGKTAEAEKQQGPLSKFKQVLQEIRTPTGKAKRRAEMSKTPSG